LIDSLRAKKGDLLLVDAGDYCHPTLTHDDRENQLVLRSMNAMRYDAMTLGELEFNHGPAYVQSILDSARVPIALANVRFAKSKLPVGQRFVISKVGDVNYGIIGLLGQDFGEGKEKFGELGFIVDDPFEVAAKVVPEVKKQADLVVVLAHLASADALQLPRAVKGIDLVIFGHYPGMVAPTKMEDALVVRPGQRGQYIAETKIILNPENKIVSYSGETKSIEVKTVKENPAIAAQRQRVKEALAAEGKGAASDPNSEARHAIE
jgi:5'-nucleotidase